MAPAQQPLSYSFQALSTHLEWMVAAFAGAWQRGEPPAINDYLKGAGANRRLVLIELVHADLGCQLLAGKPVRVEAYLQRFPELAQEREVVLSLIAAEYHTRRRTEPGLGKAEYLRRFPQYGQQLNPWFQAGAPPEAAGTLLDEAFTQAGRPDGPPPPIPGYEIREELGRGGMGVVYRALQVKLNRTVALKMIRAGSQASAMELARFIREAQGLARLQHPHIVQIYGVGEAEGQAYCALEFVEGGSLAQKLHGTPVPGASASRLMEMVARAVHAAHQAGVLHRDLKPANILLARSDRPEAVPLSAPPERYEPKVTDFGLAKRLAFEPEALATVRSAVPGEPGVSVLGWGTSTIRARTQTGAIVGTPSYMAPEQASGVVKHLTAAVDVYSLGAILYELLTGYRPFVGKSLWETVELVLTGDLVPPSHWNPKVDRDLESICLKCLEKLPAHRYPSALGLADDLHRFQTGRPIAARPVNPLGRLVRWCRRNPLAAGLAGVAAGLFLAGTIGVLLMAGYGHAARLEAVEQRQAAQAAEARAARAEAQRDRERLLAERLMNKAGTAAMDVVLDDLRDRTRSKPARAALADYEEVLALIHSGKLAEVPPLVQYDRVIAPALGLAPELLVPEADVSIKRRLAAIYAAKGKLILKHRTLSWPFARPLEEAQEAFISAIRLDESLRGLPPE
jgi:serine/threonine protein kinase